MHGSSSKRKKMCLCKRETVSLAEDGFEFVYPFAVPSDFSRDVEADLSKKSVTSRTMASCLTTAAISIISNKRYPAQVDFSIVGRSIVTEYHSCLFRLGQDMYICVQIDHHSL